jgi:hypothetical protein
MIGLDAQAPSSRPVSLLLFVVCVAGTFAAALWLRQDANWDLLNYHFYDPWAWLTGRIFDWDIAAAQLQTFHNPLADLPFYALVAANAYPRVIAFWLTLPTGVAAYFAIRIALLLFADLSPAPRVAATVATMAIGFTGAMGVGQIGTTTNEWLVTAFTLAALWLLLQKHAETARASPAYLAMSGLLMGVASGMKLTAATYAVGLCASLLARRSPLRLNIRAATWFSLGVAVGLAVAHGTWSYGLWKHFDNPLFPYGNQWIRSSWWDPRSVLPHRFGPHTFSEWVFLPFKLLAPMPGFVSEVRYVDARFPALYGLALIALGAHLIARLQRMEIVLPVQFATTSARWRFISVMFVSSFVVWAAMHSILRYTVPLEVLSGLLIVGLLRYLLPQPHATAAVTLGVIGLVATTVWSDWGRIDFGPKWFEVRVPPVEHNALILLTVDAPMSYVLPYLPPDARHVGIRNNVIEPEQRNRLAELVRTVVREHPGPLYAMSFPGLQGESDLLAHGLHRAQGGCTEIRTNMPTSPIELCRLTRVDAPAR